MPVKLWAAFVLSGVGRYTTPGRPGAASAGVPDAHPRRQSSGCHATRLTVPEFAGVLKALAQGVRLETLKKHPRGPKRPVIKKPKNNKEPHVSTARLLEKRKRTG
jgi:hypothetical protein